jgi:hypothetical protein
MTARHRSRTWPRILRYSTLTMRGEHALRADDAPFTSMQHLIASSFNVFKRIAALFQISRASEAVASKPFRRLHQPSSGAYDPRVASSTMAVEAYNQPSG